MARTSVRPFREGFRICLHFAGWLWAVDAVRVAVGGYADPRALSQALLTALFLGLLAASATGACVGALWWVSCVRLPGDPEPPVGLRLRSWLFDAHPAQLRRAGSILGSVLSLALFCAGVFLVERTLVVGMAQPHFVALASLGANLALAALALALFPAARNLGCFVLLPLVRIRGLAPRLSAGNLLLLLFGLCTCFATGALIAFWSTLSYLPWDSISTAAAALVLTGIWWRLRRRLSEAVSRVARGVAYGFAAASVVAAVHVGPDAPQVRKLAERRTLGGRAGYVLADALLDFDGDGHLHWLGGGDCAPFSRDRHPGAVDIPNNGIDEDCDGHDLVAQQLGFEAAYTHPIGENVPKRPSIVLITIDAFAARQMGVLGGSAGVTPRLDAFAETSALFADCFSQGPSTRLSFPSMFTSRWDSQIRRTLVGNHPYPIESSEVTLAEVLRDAGYDTVGVLPSGYFSKSHWKGMTQGFKRLVDASYKAKPQPKHNSHLVTDAALGELAKKRRKPLFLWVHYYDAHSPHSQPVEARSFGKRRADLYRAELSFVDAEVGRLLDDLAAVKPSPLVVVTSDHGIAFDEPRHRKLNYGYDLHTVTLNVPLLFHADYITPGRRDGVVSTMDVAPTLVNLLRLRGPFPFRGASLVPEVLYRTRVRPPYLMHQFYLQERLWDGRDPLETVAVRSDRFNLIHDRRIGLHQLYDWKTDYLETHDLADDPEHARTLYALKQQLSLFTLNLQLDRTADRGR